MSGEPFLTRAMTIFIKTYIFVKVREGKGRGGKGRKGREGKGREGKEGRKEGREEGRKRGREEGRKEGREDTHDAILMTTSFEIVFNVLFENS